MALIKCPECGKDVSDRADVCIHCGYPLSSPVIQFCVDCGYKLDENQDVCPICGCPKETIESINESIKGKTQDKVLVEEETTITSDFPSPVYTSEEPEVNRNLIVAVIVIILFLMVMLVGNKRPQSTVMYGDSSTSETQYFDTKGEIVSVMNTLNDTDKDVRYIYDNVSAVWANAAYQVNDAKTDKYTQRNSRFYTVESAINNFLVDENTKDRLESIESYRHQIEINADRISQRGGDSKVVEEFLKLVDCYLVYSDVVIEMQGDYETYNAEVYRTCEEYLTQYDLVLSMLKDGFENEV